MLTSEQQKIYNVQVPKGGYGYYTLYHGIYDPENDIDERPVYAQTGDLFEPEGSSVVYKATRRNGKTTWAIDEDAQRQSESGEGGSGGGSGGGGLPADFPAEGSANANKFLGFDANGDYTAKDAPSGGGAEKFVVTLTESNDTWTADKTIAEIVDAYKANKTVVAKYPFRGLLVDVPCLVSDVVAEGDVVTNIASFVGILNIDIENLAGITIVGFHDAEAESDIWHVNKCPNLSLPTGSNEGDVLVWDNGHDEWKAESNPYAPLVVTLTAGATEGQFVGDKTYLEAYTAFTAGRNVVYVISTSGAVESFVAAGMSFDGTSSYTLSIADSSHATGTGSEFITFSFS